MFVAILLAALVALIVYLVGTLFDKTPNNQYAGLAALVVFILLFLSSIGVLNR